MRILLLGLSVSQVYEARHTIAAFKKRGHVVNPVLWHELLFSFSKKKFKIQRKRGKDLKYYDYLLCRSPVPTPVKQGRFISRIAMSRLYRHYILIIDYMNRHSKHVLNEKVVKKLPHYDKLFQYYLLHKAGLPLISSILYTGRKIPWSVYKKFGFPYIAKNIEGSKGREVYKIKNLEQIRKLVAKFGFGRLFIQKYLPIKEDYRIIVIGNKVIGGMKRIAPAGGFKTNFSAGGFVEQIKVSPEMAALALKSACVFNAEFAGVDIIKYKNKLYILEVNLFPGFQGFEQATKIKVAEKLVDYIEKKYLCVPEKNAKNKTEVT